MKSKTEVHKEMDIISNGMHILYFYHFTILVHLHFAIGLLRGEVAKWLLLFREILLLPPKANDFWTIIAWVLHKICFAEGLSQWPPLDLCWPKKTQWDLDWNIQWVHNPFIVTVKTSQYHSKSELYKNCIQLRFCSSHDSYIHIIN